MNQGGILPFFGARMFLLFGKNASGREPGDIRELKNVSF